jgi:nitroreductase
LSTDLRHLLHPLLEQRRSTRAFDPVHEIGDAEARLLLEAARWAPSANNVQPWRFLPVRRGTEAFDRLFATLAPGNQAWVGAASMLLLAAAETVDGEGRTQPWAHYDLGQAVAHLSVQAEALGLAVHQLGGFDAPGAARAFSLPETLVPTVVVAVGVHGADVQLPSPYAERERAPRTRRPLSELVLPADVDAAATADPAALPLSA